MHRRNGGESSSSTVSSQPDVEQLASWWHTDADLGRTMETYADMTKSREAGFRDTQDTRRSFLDLFDRLREERVIPSLSEGKVATSR